MGFDNECILNIQSLAGEYFCPVCRTLVYPHEALQTRCTHLYCKPCLTYVVGSTQACPYDGYLVTEAGSKPLMQSNKALAETIGKTTVHCLYHRSGCVWQGPLSECTSHCSGCAFGNSPVVCNRCGLHIVHRQVQEHAQTCNVNGTNNQPQGSEPAQDTTAVSVDQSKVASQVAAPPASQPLPVAPPASLPPPTNPLPAVPPATAVSAPEQQWYQQQQQYQQYYQQYPGYDQYQQQQQQQPYQQYYPYQQQPQNQPLTQSQPQIQPPLQPQPQIQQGPPQFQVHSQAQPQIPSNVQPQPVYPQAAVVGSSQNQGQVNAQSQVHLHNQPLAHGHMPPQSYQQVQPHPVQNHGQPQPQPPPQPQMQVPQYQQPHPQMHQPPPQPHPHFQPLPQSQPMNPQHPPVQSVAAHHPSYPSQPHQPIQHAPPPMQVHPPAGSLPPPTQFPQPPSHMRPTQPPHMLPSQPPPTQQHVHPHSQPVLPAHPRPIVHQVQQPAPQQYVQPPPQAFPGQPPHHVGPFAQVRPQGPPQPMQQPPLGFVQPQQATSLPHGMPPQSYMGRPPPMPQQFPQPQSSGAPGISPHARPPQFGPTPSQTSINQSNVNMTNQPHVYSEQQVNQYGPPLGGGALVDRKGEQTFERRVEQQEDKSPSLKKSEPVVANEFRANFNEVKPETGINDERKNGNGGEDDHRKDEKDTVSELHQVQGVPGDSATIQREKEENKDGALDHNKTEDEGVATRDSMKQGEVPGDNGSLAVPSGSSIQQEHNERTFSQSQTSPQGQIGDISGGFSSKNTEQFSHPLVPYPPSAQKQRPAAPHSGQTPGHPPSHLRPPGHGYLPLGPHPGEHFQPPVPGSGPNSVPNNSRGYEPQSGGSHGQYSQGQPHARLNRISQGEPLGPPPLPHGPDGQTGPRHPGPMEADMYQNQRPSHFDSRRQNADMGPFGAEPNSMRMNGAPPPGHDSRDEKFRAPDNFSMGPPRHHEQGKQFPGPPHMGNEGSPKYGSHSSRPLSGYGMDGPSRFLDKDPYGFFHPYHHDDHRGRFENNRHNPDYLGPMHGFGQHRMDRSPGHPSRSFGGGPHNFDVDGREMERHSFGERFGPPGNMHRGEFDGPGKVRGGESFGLRNREPGFGSFQDYGRSGDPHGPGGFHHKQPFGEPFGAKSARPHLGEPGFRSSYSRKGFPNDGGFFAGGADSFDGSRKRNTYSMGWCRICKIDCESVEGLDLHGQTREHQRMAMDIVISIKQKSAKKHKASNEHSSREEPSKLRNAENHARVNVS